jgi:ATP-dependent Clp protease ATP-binding subunit ClpC
MFTERPAHTTIIFMFDRYSEKARRVLFFARYEASQFGTDQIESEHVLLGLLREDRFLFRGLMPSGWTIESIRRKIEFGAPVRKMVSTSVDMPISSDVKRIFTYATEEADSLGDSHVETKHLLLGILREKDCVAAKLLDEDGVRLPAAREIIAGKQRMGEAGVGFGGGSDRDRNRSRGRTVNFLNEADGKVLAATPGALVPQIGSEIVLGEVRARVTRVVYQYDKVSPPTDVAGEANPFWLREIVAYVQVTA